MGLGAECMLYMPARCDFDEVCLLLESGTNIVTTGASSTRGQPRSPGDLCQVGLGHLADEAQGVSTRAPPAAGFLAAIGVVAGWPHVGASAGTGRSR